MSATKTAPGQTKGLRFILDEMKPRAPLWTPFNVISLAIIAVGCVILVYRFINGLGSTTNLSQDFPWGIWKGFNVITGVAFAGGAYALCFTVYVMGLEKYKPIIRVTVLNGFLAYVFYAGALILELGRPWNILNPIIGNDFGYNSVLFLVAWHFLLYIIAQFLEVSPVVAEWLDAKKAYRVLHGMTIGLVIFGITLSFLHQSGLGALFLMAKPKIHPLWYSEFIPILFFVSSIFAGISLVIVEGTLSGRFLSKHIGIPDAQWREIMFGLAKGAAIASFAYYFFKLLLFLHEGQWSELGTGWGLWYLVEVFGLTLFPCLLFAIGYRHRSLGIIKVAAVLSLLGVLINRLNVSLIAYNWDVPTKYYPTWMEVVVSLTVVLVEVWVFRWFVTRMTFYPKPLRTAEPAEARTNGTPVAAVAEHA